MWPGTSTMWVIGLRNDEKPGEVVVLQGEAEGRCYVLAFSAEALARSAIRALALEGAAPVQIGLERRAALVDAALAAGASGVAVDYDPTSRRCSYRRPLEPIFAN